MSASWTDDQVMARVKRAMLGREGINGIRVLVATFRNMDKNNDNNLTASELDAGLRALGVTLAPSEIAYLTRAFDTNRDGKVTLDEFLAHMIGGLAVRRKRVIDKSYAALVARNGSPLEPKHILNEFDTTQHPLVISGQATASDIAAEFLGAFGVDSNKDGIVSQEEFTAFFAGLSATIPSDDVFETMILRAFRVDDTNAPRLAETKRTWQPRDPLENDLSATQAAVEESLKIFGSTKAYSTDGLHQSKYNKPVQRLPTLKKDFTSTMKADYVHPTQDQIKASLTKKDAFSPTGDPVLDGVRRKILERVGEDGFVGLQRSFRTFDTNRDQKITLAEFATGLQRIRITLTPAELAAVSRSCDPNGDGSITIGEFSRVVRGPIRSPARIDILLEAFSRLDPNGNGVISLEEIAPRYDVSRLKTVTSGEQTAEQAIRLFIADWDQNRDGSITVAEWMDYYANISCTIDNDQYFELMIRNAWHISGGTGAAQNTSCRRVLAIFGDGSQKVLEIKNDIGVRKDDIPTMMANLRAQGHTGIVELKMSF